MQYFVKYIKETRYALIEKTKEFKEPDRAINFAKKHRTLEVWMTRDDQTHPYVYDWDTDSWYCV